MVRVGDRIRQERLRRGWSQKELGARAGGRDVTQINGYECHRSVPSIPVQEAIAQAFGMSLTELAGEAVAEDLAVASNPNAVDALVRRFKEEFARIAQVDASRVSVVLTFP